VLQALFLIEVDLMFNPGGFSSIAFAVEFPTLGLTKSCLQGIADLGVSECMMCPKQRREEDRVLDE
jgi:hypothetical protein